MARKNPFIGIIGNIGTGKSTGAKLAAKRLNFALLEENFSENNFLPHFYKNMGRWAFYSQLFFLIEKINQMASIKNKLKKGPVIQDVSIYQDVFVYADAQKILKNLNNEEYRLYRRIYQKAESFLPRPDFIVYLRQPPETLFPGIKKRGMHYEKNISVSYLNLLHQLLEKWTAKNSKKFRILTIDTQKINFIKRPTDKKRFIDLIKSEIKNLAKRG